MYLFKGIQERMGKLNFKIIPVNNCFILTRLYLIRLNELDKWNTLKHPLVLLIEKKQTYKRLINSCKLLCHPISFLLSNTFLSCHLTKSALFTVTATNARTRLNVLLSPFQSADIIKGPSCLAALHTRIGRTPMVNIPIPIVSSSHWSIVILSIEGRIAINDKPAFIPGVDIVNDSKSFKQLPLNDQLPTRASYRSW